MYFVGWGRQVTSFGNIVANILCHARALFRFELVVLASQICEVIVEIRLAKQLQVSSGLGDQHSMVLSLNNAGNSVVDNC